MNIHQFQHRPFIGILRGVKPETLPALLDAAIEGGLTTLEITMNTEDAPTLIRSAIAHAAGRLTIGAGTVLDGDRLHRALDAGARFIVMPTLVREVVEECVDRAVPVFPGALTPQEIFEAWKAGATMVKVFPARFFGPSYFKEIKGPLDAVRLLACGGVTTETVPAYLANGADAFAFGGGIFKPQWIEERDFGRITSQIQALLRSYADATREGSA